MVLRISWSSLREHETCRQRGHLQRTGKKAPLSDRRNFFPGNVTDRVVRDWLQEGAEPGAMPQMVQRVMDREYDETVARGEKITFRGTEDRKKILADCTEAVTRIEPTLLRFVVPFDYQADFSFRAPIDLPHPDGGSERVLLIGKMDIIIRDGDGRYSVFDVKHTRDDTYWRKTIAQLSFYDFATLLMFGAPTRATALFQPLCKQPEMPMQQTDQSRTELMTRVAKMAADIWRQNFTPRSDSKECWGCNVKHACSKFTPIINGRSKRVALL